MSCDFSDRDGAYVLGALSPTERLEFEQHLSGCADCARAVRELAGIPGLLARVDPSVLENPPVEEPVPDTLLPALIHQVRRTRRRRGLVTVGAAAATVAVAVLALAVSRSLDGERTPTAAGPSAGTSVTTAAGRAMVPVGHAPVRATLSFAKVAWGTRLDLSCTYAPDAERYHMPHAVTYALFVRTRQGSTEQVGTWKSLEGRTMRLTAATAVSLPDIASVEVRTAKGRPVLELSS